MSSGSQKLRPVRKIESQIESIEGFWVSIGDPQTQDMYPDSKLLPPYPYTKAAKESMTVARWKRVRFSEAYPDSIVVVFNDRGENIPGNTTLATLRDYIQDREEQGYGLEDDLDDLDDPLDDEDASEI